MSLRMIFRGHPSVPTPAGGGSSMTVGLKQTGKKLLITGAAATALAAVPTGNAVALTVDPTVEVTIGTLHTEVADAKVTPAAAWTGTAASGYGSWVEDSNVRTMPPTKSAAQGNGTAALGDQARTTAKPICQLLEPWNRAFTGKLYLPVRAVAAGGIAKVRMYAEGGYVDVATPCNYHYTDAAGVERWIDDAYLFCLDAADWTSVATDNTRQIQLFFRAFATDGTMQTQLLGVPDTSTAYTQSKTKILLNPRSAIHDVLVQVTPSAGSDTKPNGTYPAANAIFRKLEDAVAYAAGATRSSLTIAAAAKAARIEITENCTLSPVSLYATTYHSDLARFVITTSSGVTANIGKTAYDATTTTDPASGVGIPNYCWMPGVSNIEWRGPGIKFVCDNYGGIGVRNSDNLADWMNATQVVSTLNLRQFLWKTKRTYGDTCNINEPFMTENDLAYQVMSFNALNRHNTTRDAYNDLFNQTPVVYRNTVIGCGANYHAVDRPAFQIIYTGSGAVATIGKAGFTNGNITAPAQLTVDGSVTDSPTPESLGTLTALVAWINTQSGWSATLDASVVLNDNLTDRHPSTIASETGQHSAWTSANCKSTTRTITTYLDIHVDFYQWQNLTYLNKLIEGNKCFGLVGVQTKFIDGVAQDCAMINNVYENNSAGVSGQVGRSDPMSHVIMRGETDPGTGIVWSSENASDSYCRCEGNVWDSYNCILPGSLGQYPVFTDCHFGSILTALDQGSQVSSGCTSGSNESTLFPNLVSGMDPTPAGSLLTNTVTKKSNYDAYGAKIPATTWRGAKAIPQASASLSKSQALELAAITVSDTIGSDVGHITLSWKDGSGETGSTQTFAIHFDVAA